MSLFEGSAKIYFYKFTSKNKMLKIVNQYTLKGSRDGGFHPYYFVSYCLFSSSRCCFLFLFLTVRALICVRLGLVVLVDPIQHSVIDGTLRSGELELVLSHLNEYGRPTQCADEDLVRRYSSVFQSLFEFLLGEGTSVQSDSEDVDGFDVIDSHECVLSHVSLPFQG